MQPGERHYEELMLRLPSSGTWPRSRTGLSFRFPPQYILNLPLRLPATTADQPPERTIRFLQTRLAPSDPARTPDASDGKNSATAFHALWDNYPGAIMPSRRFIYHRPETRRMDY
jgi:hypothetical protein